MALHETAHVLGFVSGVDDPGWLNVVLDSQTEKKGKIKDHKINSTPLDLFRYSSNSIDKKSARPDLSIGSSDGTNPYFSIDGGDTALAEFSSTKHVDLGGDGYQASHWKHDPENPIGIMDPALAPGDWREVTPLDLLALDVIGWDLETVLGNDSSETDKGKKGKSKGKSGKKGKTAHKSELEYLTEHAEAQLADRLEVSVDWLWSNADTSASLLNQDQLTEVIDMIEQSQVYEWGRRARTRTYTRWQEVIDLMTQEGRFSMLDSLHPNATSGNSAGPARRQPGGPAQRDSLNPQAQAPLTSQRGDNTEPPGSPGGVYAGVPGSRGPLTNTARSQPTGSPSLPSSTQSFSAPINLGRSATLELGIGTSQANPMLPDILASNGLGTDPLLVQDTSALFG